MKHVLSRWRLPWRIQICLVASASISCNYVAAPGPPAQFIAASATKQLVEVGGTVALRPSVQVLDSRGRPVGGRQVTFATGSGSGTIDGASQTTDRRGIATVDRWTIGAGSGEYTVHAVLGEGPIEPVLFTAIGIPPAFVTGPSARQCPIPGELIPSFSALERSMELLRGGKPLTIVAIGSSSTAGAGASTVSKTYPFQLQRMLSDAFPSSTIRVINKGVNGTLASDMVQRFDTAVFAQNPELVIWQTGTIEAQGTVPLDSFLVVLDTGIRRIQERGIDLMLFDSQRYPGTGESARYKSFQRAMADAAAQHRIPIIRRYEWMEYLMRSGYYTYEQLLAADRLHMSDLMYECLAYYATVGFVVADAGRAVNSASSPY